MLIFGHRITQRVETTSLYSNIGECNNPKPSADIRSQDCNKQNQKLIYMKTGKCNKHKPSANIYIWSQEYAISITQALTSGHRIMQEAETRCYQ